LDKGDHPHLSYYDYTNSDLKYAHWDGSSWYIEAIDTAGDVGVCTSIVLDSSGHPHISYVDNSFSGALKYAWYGE